MTLKTIKFDEKGLIPAIVQDAETGEILMFAWMNEKSFRATMQTGEMTYWSRSRQKLWKKGETSGNVQIVREAFIDCDADCLLFRVETRGHNAACHDGYKSCFYRRINPDDISFDTCGERKFDPDIVYRKNKDDSEKTPPE